MKYKIGDKVILKSKHGSIDELYFSEIYRRIKNINQPYGYVTGFKDNLYIINSELDIYYGDYYEEKDIECHVKYERKLKLEKIKTLNKLKK